MHGSADGIPEPAPVGRSGYIAAMRRLVAALLGSAVALGILAAAEVRLRHDERFVVWLWDSGRRFATRPGVGGANSASFHERELPAAPDPNVRRVVVLGDSMTWGTGPAEEAWPRLAEDRLGPPWQILNFSHYGYDVAQARAVLREHVWAYDPDLVIYATYTNDPLPSRIVEVGGGPVWVGDGGLLPSPLRRASALARRAEGALLARTVDETPDWDFYRRELAAMKADAEAHDTPLIVYGLVPHVLAERDLAACSARLGVPGRCETHAEIAAEQEWIAEELGLPFTSVLPALRQTGKKSLPPPDPTDWQHPGREGHEAIATFVASHLRAVH